MPVTNKIILINFLFFQSSGTAPKYTKEVQQFKLHEENKESLMVTLTDESTWPTPQVLGLDESQYNAYKMALTTEFVTIQGPPGTGKTFLGLKIVITILRNFYKDRMDLLPLVTLRKPFVMPPPMRNYRPILVVCFTNHALDQFLEGLLPVTTAVVRVGGQSKNKNLEKFNLKKLRRYDSENYHLKKQLQLSSMEIEDLQALLETLQSSEHVVDVTHHQLTFTNSNSDHEVVKQLRDNEKFFEHFVFGKRPPLLNWLLMTDHVRRYNRDYTQISEKYGYDYSYLTEYERRNDDSSNTGQIEYSYKQLMFEVEQIKSDLNINRDTWDWQHVKILRTHIQCVLCDVNKLKVCWFELYIL